MARVILKRDDSQRKQNRAVYKARDVNNVFKSYGHDLKPGDLTQDKVKPP